MPVMILFSEHSGPDKRIVKYKANMDYIMWPNLKNNSYKNTINTTK